MSDRKRLIVVTAVVLVVAVVALFILPRTRQAFAPVPHKAVVAVQIGDDGVASVGGPEVTIPQGTPFRLYAVLEAAARDGKPVYYTQAPALRVDGENVPADAIQPWDERLEAHVLWFTVEGAPAFVRAGDEEAEAAFKLREVHRADWPQAWSIPGSVEPSIQTLAAGRDTHGPMDFGTAAYQVRVLLYGPESKIRPRERFFSPGVDALVSEADVAPRVTVTLPGRLGPVSSVFGLPQFEADPEHGKDLSPRLRKILELGLAFRRAVVLHKTLELANTRWDDLSWSDIDLESGPTWGENGAQAGDLVRSGGRLVLLWRDADGDGRLSDGDLCFDLQKGPAVRALGEVFTGEGLVEWATLGSPSTPAEPQPESDN